MSTIKTPDDVVAYFRSILDMPGNWDKSRITQGEKELLAMWGVDLQNFVHALVMVKQKGKLHPSRFYARWGKAGGTNLQSAIAVFGLATKKGARWKLNGSKIDSFVARVEPALLRRGRPGGKL